MDFEIRPATAEERVSFVRAVEAAFGHQPTPEDLEDVGWEFEPERSLMVLDAGRIVATTGAISLELTLPAAPGQTCPVVPAAGVTAVGVHPTHRRRGILRELMARQLDDVAARGEAVAILTASEGGIYGRFGYGRATLFNSIEVDKARSAFAVTLDDKGGRVRLVDTDEAGKVLPPLFDAARQSWPGQVARTPGFWKWIFRDIEADRDGASARWYVVHETDGRLDGYAMYRIKHSSDPGNHVILREVQAIAPKVRLALWRYLLDIDLVTTLKAEFVCVDEPLPWALADPRRAKVTVGQHDWLWARILDVPAALSARGYSADGRLVFDVSDAFRPATAGRFVLVVRDGTASCQRAEGAEGPEPDLGLDISSLSAAYLGGVRLSTLAAAGRVHHATPAVLAQADAMFASTPFPWCASGF